MIVPELCPHDGLQSQLPVHVITFPPVQLMQVLAPTFAEYWLTGQLMQVELTFAPTVPEYLPAAQSVQTEAPAAAEYVPVGHNEQVSADVAPA